MATKTQQATFLGHPIGLYVLFFTEMWERFSYYGMRALLVFYLVEVFKQSQEQASLVYKWYTSLVYLTPLLGGYLADRFLGNKWAIIIGAVLMSIGHFLMAWETWPFFYSALAFLIIGNGFFKPNMSVQVGRLYPQNDPRRDSAYTIFYMGINLGAFLSPFVCGALKETPGLGFAWGFGAAGVGMVLGLIVYLLGLPLIKELPPDAVYEGEVDGKSKDDALPAMTEAEAANAPSAIPSISKVAPFVLGMVGSILSFVGLFIAISMILKFAFGSSGLYDMIDKGVAPLNIKADSAFALALGGGAACLMGGWITSKVALALRDRVLSILVIGLFVIFFWAAFEQAGNAMNVWADQTTDRYLTEKAPAPDVYPDEHVDAAEQGYWETVKVAIGKLFKFNPVLTTSFQSINAFAIVVFAPLFAWLWVTIARKGYNISIAVKVAIGVFLQGMAFALMIWAATYERGPSAVALSDLPAAVVTMDDNVVHFHDAPDLEGEEGFEKLAAGNLATEETMIAHGGRLRYDEAANQLDMTGVLDANHRDRMLRATADPAFVIAVREMAKASEEAKKAADAAGEEEFTFTHKFDAIPEGFEGRYLRGFDPDELSYDPETQSFTVGMEIADKDYKQILVAGSDPKFRSALNELYVSSAKYRVSSWWLVWFYVLCTLGELCLSPVGLSMVSKLAPRRFATMLMGMWLLTSFFGNFAAGLAGENWDKLDPMSYFTYITIALTAAAFICFLLARKITAMMHGVK